ncbi:MAG: sulfatase-like hydrolase/transferase [Elusimicrobia bacterium]|nr:sulfatase-like hydrolase/transferase [Elusimicrobiota bacterium]
MRKPNIILLVLDGLRADRLSCYGHWRKTSPYLDSLCDRMTIFRNHRTVNTSSMGAHTTLVTGLHPYVHCAPDEHCVYTKENPTIFQFSKSKGYHTSGISTENIFLSREAGFMRGFCDYAAIVKSYKQVSFRERRMFVSHAVSPRYTDRIIRRLVMLIEKVLGGGRKDMEGPAYYRRLADFFLYNDMAGKQTVKLMKQKVAQLSHGKEPFFIFGNILDTHRPYLAPEGFRDFFGPLDVSDRILQISFDEFLAICGKIELSDEEKEVLSALYDAKVLYANSLLKDLLGWIDANSNLDDLMIFITADHGEMLLEKPRALGHRFFLYENVLRTPLMVLGGEFSQPRRYDHPTTIEDIAVTIANIVAGRDNEFSKGATGCDLRDIDQDRVVVADRPFLAFPEIYLPHRSYMVEHFNSIDRAVIFRSKKLIWNSQGRMEFYDLNLDPQETANLYGDPLHQPEAAKLLELMQEWYRHRSADGVFNMNEYELMKVPARQRSQFMKRQINHLVDPPGIVTTIYDQVVLDKPRAARAPVVAGR